MTKTRDCEWCGTRFEAKYSNSRFCSKWCGRLSYAEKVTKSKKASHGPFKCATCGKTHDWSSHWRKYCSYECRHAAKKKLNSASRDFKLPSSTVGTINELLVAADLLQRGFQVFRALSPSCDCDLAVLIGKRLVRLEVTTGVQCQNGNASFARHDPGRYDAIAIMVSNAIRYTPAVETWKTAFNGKTDPNGLVSSL